MVKANNRQTTGSIFDSKLAGREFGKYRAEKLISRHEFRQTITLLAINKETKERVVLKAFGSFSVKSKKEFEKEIAAFTKLESRHGVLLPLEKFEYEGDYFIVTEYKNGGDLREWLNKKPGMVETLDVFTKIAESIDYVHENKIIHRDIKPENVVYEVLGGRVTPYLMDFGISVTLSSTTLSFETKNPIGTIEYMAPEFFLDVDAKKTKAIDIYAFGLMLYEALEGRHPFLGSTQQDTMAQIISGVVPVPENTIKRLGEDAGFMLTKALSKKPEDRPETATEIIEQVGLQYTRYVGKTYDRYVVEEYLGQGLYGVTCKAYELNRKGRKVAIKLLPVSRLRKTEIGELKGFEHDRGILPVIDGGYENGTQYLVSEYLNGENLRQVLSSQEMGMQDILKILKPLSAALDYLHGKGVVHCDLKPENILLQKNKVDGNLQPFINDYGVSTVVDAIDVVNANGNALLTNLSYLAPEILEGGKPTVAADVYSLGIIIYEAIEGKTPFDARSLPALIKQKLDDDVTVPKKLLDSSGVRAARVLLKALNVSPDKRQKSASELVSQLEDAIVHRTFADVEILVEPWVRARRFISNFKKNSYAPWISVLLLLLASWGVFSLLPARQTPVPIATLINTSTVTVTPSVTPTFTPSVTPVTPSSIVAEPAIKLPDQCELPMVSTEYDYTVPGHLLLSEVYEQKFSKESDSNDMYAIAYYNNRKVQEGYSKYAVIHPVSLDVRKGWKIFLPSQDWIDAYEEFPATIPFPVSEGSQATFDISGSSVLSRLSAQISKCATKTVKAELVQINSGTTDLGLRDLCQSKVKLFGASKVVDQTMLEKFHCDGIELEKFEVARYAMMILVNKNNPNAEDMQSNSLTREDLANLLLTANSWKDVRKYWVGDGIIARYYPSLREGEFEIVKNGAFPDRRVDQDNVPGLSINDDAQSVIDGVVTDVNAVGIVDYISYQNYQNKNELVTVPINGVYVGSAIDDAGSAYPLISTLYLYTTKSIYEKDEALRGFINYYLSHELDFLDDLGYLYPSKKGYAGNRDTVP